MGLFDTIHYNGNDYQSKDMECYMNHYEITGGRLLERFYEGEPGVVTRTVDLNFHGILNFYGEDLITTRWTEYNAKFTDGTMVDEGRLTDADQCEQRADGSWLALNQKKDNYGLGGTRIEALRDLTAREDAIQKERWKEVEAIRETHPDWVAADKKRDEWFQKNKELHWDDREDMPTDGELPDLWQLATERNPGLFGPQIFKKEAE